MPDDAYRAGQPPVEDDAALARLAAEGQRKIHDAATSNEASARAMADRNRDVRVRSALGAHYGSPVRKAARILFFVAIPLLIAGSVATHVARGDLGDMVGIADFGETLSVVLGILAVVCFVVAMFLVNWPPMCTPARVAAEQAWSTSLPFAMDGYFDLLGSDDCVACHIDIDVEWAPGRPVELSVVEGAAGALDAEARAELKPGGAIRIRSTALPSTYYDNHRNRQGTNRQLAAYMHAFIDRVLVPIHRSHPIARIVLSRDFGLSDQERARSRTLGFDTRKW